jgi:uncharacterized membrane protein YfcA
MYFPIADVTVNPLFLAAVGGGFLAGPMMFSVGVPMNFVVGTDLAHMTGKSIVAARRHRILGHVDVRLGVLMIIGTIPGVELGARIIEWLEAAGSVDVVVGWTYIIILVAIGIFTAWESLRALHLVRTERMEARDALAFQAITRRAHGLRLRPMISLPVSGIESISLWIILGVSFLTGLLAGMLGVGGGFIRMPLLVYLVGVPTHVAVGTDLFSIVV